MATKDHHILNVQEDISKQATTSSGLKIVESDSDLRRKSLPSIAPLNLEVSSAVEAPRSCSANDAYSQDTPHMACLLPSIETKAAFEDNSPLLPSQADVKAKRLAKKRNFHSCITSVCATHKLGLNAVTHLLLVFLILFRSFSLQDYLAPTLCFLKISPLNYHQQQQQHLHIIYSAPFLYNYQKRITVVTGSCKNWTTLYFSSAGQWNTFNVSLLLALNKSSLNCKPFISQFLRNTMLAGTPLSSLILSSLFTLPFIIPHVILHDAENCCTLFR